MLFVAVEGSELFYCEWKIIYVSNAGDTVATAEASTPMVMSITKETECSKLSGLTTVVPSATQPDHSSGSRIERGPRNGSAESLRGRVWRKCWHIVKLWRVQVL